MREPDELQVTISESSIGLVLVAQSEKGVTAVLLGDDRDALRTDLQSRFPNAVLTDHVATWNERTIEVIELVESSRQEISAPLDMRGSEFQRSVWRALQEIPAGTTASYSEVASRIGRPGAERAVAAACASNHLAVVVPCHRVVRSDGQLSGYRWGVDRKRLLLDRERRWTAPADANAE